jgi:histone H3/H4
MELDNIVTEPVMAEEESVETPDGSDEDGSELSQEDEVVNDTVDLDADEEEEIVLDEDSLEEGDTADGLVADDVADENAPQDNRSALGVSISKLRAPTCPLDLPLSVVRRIMKSVAGNRRFTPELISALSRCAGVFALYLLSACQDASVASDRNTIRPVEVVRGLIACGFPEVAEEARIAMGLKPSDVLSRKKKSKKKVKTTCN